MNIKLALSIATLMFSSPVALAGSSTNSAGGVIMFQGAVSESTCNVTTNGDKDFTVTLDPVSIDDVLAFKISDTGKAKFTMGVTGCEGYNEQSTSAQSLTITFSGANVSDDNKYLVNNLGTASGVGLVITRDGQQVVALNQAVKTTLNTQSSNGQTFDQGPEGNIEFYVNYYGNGDIVKQGSIITSAVYTFDYE